MSKVHMTSWPPMREERREMWQGEPVWCFKCRKRLPHDAVLMVPTEPSYYGPHWQVECSGCGEDHVHFPGRAPDGPTIGMAEA